MKKLFIPLGLFFLLFSASITITNDSQFHLYATIYNAAGQKEDTIRLRPSQTYMWYGGNYYDPFKEQLNQPYAPYTIVWTCNEHGPDNPKQSKKKNQYVTEFGTWNNVAVGSTVTAMGSPIGTKSCKISKKKKSSKQYSPNTKSSQDSGFNSFSNDGGQTWTNDGGPSPTEDDD